MGRLAVQAGLNLTAFLPKDWEPGFEPRLAFGKAAQAWIATFYSDAANP